MTTTPTPTRHSILPPCHCATSMKFHAMNCPSTPSDRMVPGYVDGLEVVRLAPGVYTFLDGRRRVGFIVADADDVFSAWIYRTDRASRNISPYYVITVATFPDAAAHLVAARPERAPW